MGTATVEHDEALGYHLEQAHQCRVELGEGDSDRTRRLAERAAGHLAAAANRALDRDDVATTKSCSVVSSRSCPPKTLAGVRYRVNAATR